MKIINFKILNGPNIFHHKPVAKMTVNLQQFSDLASNEIKGFNERLIERFPGLRDHRCSVRESGGFIIRLKRGTYFAHIIEHITLELTELCGSPVSFGKTVYGGSQGVYDIAVRFNNPHSIKYLLYEAVEAVRAAAEDKKFDIAPLIREAQRIERTTNLGPSTMAILNSATERGIPWRRLNDGSLVQLGYGKKRRLIKATQADSTSIIGCDIASDKDLTKKLLHDANLPVPAGGLCADVSELEELLKDITLPCVIKPLDANQGRGVATDLRNIRDIKSAFKKAQEISRHVVVEQFFEGSDYRVLVVNGKMVAASLRIPAKVKGDGNSTIEQLIAIENSNPLRGDGHEFPLTKIHEDEALHQHLKSKNYTLNSIPKNGEIVFLRGTANLSTGGTAIDVTEIVHPDVAFACERAARVVNLDICGIDVISEDISKPFNLNGGIIEVNAAPGIRMHEFPFEGKPRPVGKTICSMLFPDSETGRIPIVAITGTNGKTTVSRMISHTLLRLGHTVGNTNSEGVNIGGREIARGDTAGYQSALSILADPSVDMAVFEVARGGIIKKGLAYDWSDVSVLTNIQPDHFGQNNIENLEDLLHIKILVAERTRRGGTLVLNADDELLASVPQRIKFNDGSRKIIFFSLFSENDVVKKHCVSGGTAYIVEDEWIIERTGSFRKQIMRVSEVPQSANGTLSFQIQNTMASIAALSAFSLEPIKLLDGIKSFEPWLNPGRMNWHEVGAGHVLLDYGHNPGAFQAWEAFLKTCAVRRTCVLGLPGDRDDGLLSLSCKIVSANYDRVIIKEDFDLRGRQRGEISDLLANCLLESNPDIEITKINDEGEALQYAIDSMASNEVIFMFYEDRDLVQSILSKNGAILLKDAPPLNGNGINYKPYPPSIEANA
jgi:cyanophycin synthetase